MFEDIKEKLKEKAILEAEFINICNREIQYHTDRSFHYYMNMNYEESNNELEKIKDLADKAIIRLSKISQIK